MRKVVIDMQNYLFSDAIAKVLKSYDSDFFIEMSDTPDKTAELCRVIQSAGKCVGMLQTVNLFLQ